MIRSMIVHLQLEPGAWVSENELAETFSLSRTPVREALQELGKVRLIEVYPQKGSRVALIDWDMIEEARFLRRSLERGVAELLCDAITGEGIARLREQLRWQDVYLNMDDTANFLRADNAFHEQLFREARKETSFQMMTGMTAHFDRVRHMTVRMETNRARNRKDHGDLVDAIERGDKRLADEIIVRHLTHNQVDENAIRECYPSSYFAGDRS